MYAQMPDSKHPDVFDVLSCEFGCNVGPGTGTKQTIFDIMDQMKSVEKEAKSRRKTGVFKNGEDKLFKKFDEELNFNDFMRNYHPTMPTPLPTDNQLDAVFNMMGKHTNEERNYNCHACGYKSCKDMATAICRGLNNVDNCIVHAKSVLIARHSALAEQHELLREITNDCLELSIRLQDDLKDIMDSIHTIGDSTSKTNDRATEVNDLLTSVIDFCNDNKTMDADSVKQLASILGMTQNAFRVLDDNVVTTNKSSEVIAKAVDEINMLVDSINDNLAKAERKK